MNPSSWRTRRAVAAAITGTTLFLNQALPGEQDYEDKWDYLADSGNLSPHQASLQRLLEHRVILLSHDINAVSVQQIAAALLLLEQRSPGKEIHLYIRSNGGWTHDVFAIIGVMESITSPVHTYAAGCVSSAGAMLLAAGTGTRTALPYSTISVHDNISGPEEDDEPFASKRISRAKELAFWKKVAKLPETWLQGGGDVSYYLDPAQALEFGLIDRIVEAKGKR